MVYIETPANPTNTLYDIEWGKRLAEHFSSDAHKPVVVVDNTYLGPLWQHPLTAWRRPGRCIRPPNTLAGTAT
ncbi:PLP-dependent transferase [Thermonema sp.]|uniref:PLP-dependent transferase n=1 Tax=Thermonema sp. TaxID=2231181 RepID=UPI0027E57D20|nr:PLP-dependent transferase [Thermonema sp.]